MLLLLLGVLGCLGYSQIGEVRECVADSCWNGVNSDISYGIGLLVAKFTEFNTCCYLSNNVGSSGISIGEGGFSIGEGGDSGIGRD